MIAVTRTAATFAGRPVGPFDGLTLCQAGSMQRSESMIVAVNINFVIVITLAPYKQCV